MPLNKHRSNPLINQSIRFMKIKCAVKVSNILSRSGVIAAAAVVTINSGSSTSSINIS
jgi:hypothetical protein